MLPVLRLRPTFMRLTPIPSHHIPIVGLRSSHKLLGRHQNPLPTIRASRPLHTSQAKRLPHARLDMSSEPKDLLSEVLIPSLPNRVYNFWFRHVDKDESLTLPSPDIFKPWFTRSSEFDLGCTTQFKPILSTIHQAQSNTLPNRILELVNPKSALDWLGLIILLDQIPRNCYREAESALVFTFFDPLARTIALRAIEAGIPSTSPEVRYRLALRFWFYLPLMHAEDMAVHEVALERYREMDGDVRRLLGGGRADWEGGELSGEEARYGRTLLADPEAAEGVCALHLKMERDHRDIIARFGRYPHRNKALGRVSTVEEERFLGDGNSFGG